MLDRFTQKLGHDAGMSSRYSHCALKPSSRLTRAIQCSIVLGISGDGVITSYPFCPQTTKLYYKYHVIQPKIMSFLFS